MSCPCRSPRIDGSAPDNAVGSEDPDGTRTAHAVAAQDQVSPPATVREKILNNFVDVYHEALKLRKDHQIRQAEEACRKALSISDKLESSERRLHPNDKRDPLRIRDVLLAYGSCQLPIGKCKR